MAADEYTHNSLVTWRDYLSAPVAGQAAAFLHAAHIAQWGTAPLPIALDGSA